MNSSTYIYKAEFVNQLLSEAARGDFDKFKRWKFGSSKDFIEIRKPNYSLDFQLEVKDEQSSYELENCKNLYEQMKNLTPSQATDSRLWTYLAHEKYYNFSRNRWELDFDKSSEEIYKQISKHHILSRHNMRAYMEHAIASLWWISHITYDENFDDPYKLTKELISDSDYTRTLVTSVQGRNRTFLHALLEYASESEWIQSGKKEEKIRALMRRMNFIAGYKLLGSLSREELLDIIRDESGILEKEIK